MRLTSTSARDLTKHEDPIAYRTRLYKERLARQSAEMDADAELLRSQRQAEFADALARYQAARASARAVSDGNA
jgi:hypothetical protein